VQGADVAGRWALATTITAATTAAALAIGMLGFGLGVADAATIAGLVWAVVGAPAAAWASRSRTDAPVTPVGSAVAPPEPMPEPPSASTVAEPTPRRVSNLAPRNLTFVGRDAALAALRERLKGPDPVVVQALYGLGGVGKTALALEYAYRYAADYDITWWVDGEHANLIGEQVAGLAVEADWVPADADSTQAIAEVRRRLTQTNRWLIVFDNAQAPDELRSWLTLGSGDVLVTSRHPGWDQIATKLEVNVFQPDESSAFLRRAVPRLTSQETDLLAERTGNLPLALAQAAGVLAESAMTATSYLDELARHADRVLSERPPSGYPISFAATIGVSVRQLQDRDEAALHLLQLCALFAPDPVPLDLLFPAPEGALSQPLASRNTRFEIDACARLLGRLGLARLSTEGMELHRLTQHVLRDRLDPKDAERLRVEVEKLLVDAAPTTSDDPASWSTWGRLMPHIIALQPARADDPEVRELATDAVRYLLSRGEPGAARDLCDDLVVAWHERYGEADRIALNAAHHLARALREVGAHQDALDLAEGVLEHYRSLDGDDHPSSLAAATGVAVSLRALGRTREALDLDRDTLDRKLRALGPDHPSTLASANGLAADLRELGRHDEAEALDRDTLERKRRELGPRHPSTLASAANLAADLRLQGQLEPAAELLDEVFTTAGPMLGPSHPTTLETARQLGADLRELGDTARADELDEYVRVNGAHTDRPS
jgi:tetratricopeptide (TPR) repeat protein